MNNINRRKFVKNSLFTATALGLLPKFALAAPKRPLFQPNVHANIRGANDDIRMAIVGFNGRGQSHISAFESMKGVRVVAFCDVDQRVLDREVQRRKDKNETVQGYRDIRKMLENDDIDAISVATPNHWHALNAIWAIQAGKDVYLEKPVSHNVWEGRQIVVAARKYNRIVQTGTQSRTGLREGIQWLHEGNMGKVIRARGLCYKRRKSIGKTTGPQPIPASIDYDLWCGPAPMEPLRRAKLHYDWHWVWSTGCGDLGNQGIHQMDIARWALGVNELSPRVFSVGGRFGYEDDGTTPNTLMVFHDYQPAPLIFEVRGLPAAAGGGEKMDEYRGASIGVIVDCEGGSLVIPSYTHTIFKDKSGKEIKSFKGEGDKGHFVNFIKAVRSRNAGDLNADILEGHLSSALCHTGNLSYRLGHQEKPAKITDALKRNPDAAETIERMEQHLAANQVDTAKTKATLGEFLKMDPKTERFTNSRKANHLLTREYRKPYVVPEEV